MMDSSEEDLIFSIQNLCLNKIEEMKNRKLDNKGNILVHAIFKNIKKMEEIEKYDSMFKFTKSDLNTSNNQQETPFLLASKYNNNVDVLKFLVDRKASLHQRNTNEEDALFYAFEKKKKIFFFFKI